MGIGTMPVKWAVGLLSVLLILAPDRARADEPACVYMTEADPHSKLWFDDDGAMITERLGERLRYPTSSGGGTGLMTRIYHPEDPSIPAAAVLFYDLSEIAKPDAPQSIVFAFANAYLPMCKK